jgi:DNA-binding transcriptional LysR family regulator
VTCPPANRASRSLVKFVFGEENEHEEALYGTANHQVSEGSHFVAVGHILQTTDLIAVVPEAYAVRTLAPFGLQSAACPVKIPNITINVLWHARNHREPGNQWLRQLVFDEFSP